MIDDSLYFSIAPMLGREGGIFVRAMHELDVGCICTFEFTQIKVLYI